MVDGYLRYGSVCWLGFVGWVVFSKVGFSNDSCCQKSVVAAKKNPKFILKKFKIEKFRNRRGVKIFQKVIKFVKKGFIVKINLS